MMKKILSLILVLVLTACAMLAISSCEREEEVTIYDIINGSAATGVTASIRYTTADGDDFSGWYVVKRNGNDLILEYDFERYSTIEESIANGNHDTIVHEIGKVYYLDGKYYNSGDETKTPWVGAAMDVNFALNVERNKLAAANNSNENILYATVTPENCTSVFGHDFGAKENVTLVFETNGVQLVEYEMSYVTESGASVNITATYSYGEQELDFSEIVGEPEEE